MTLQYEYYFWLSQIPKNSTYTIIYRNVFKENYSQAQLQIHIYTDASSKVGYVRMAIICDEITIQWKLSNNCSMYIAETMKILKANERIISNVDDNNIKIFSDSLSNLNSIQNCYTPSDIARKIQYTHITAQKSGKNIT